MPVSRQALCGVQAAAHAACYSTVAPPADMCDMCRVGAHVVGHIRLESDKASCFLQLDGPAELPPCTSAEDRQLLSLRFWRWVCSRCRDAACSDTAAEQGCTSASIAWRELQTNPQLGDVRQQQQQQHNSVRVCRYWVERACVAGRCPAATTAGWP